MLNTLTMRIICTLLCFLSIALIRAQVSENFSDGDFSANPIWTGDDSLFVVESEVLRSQDNFGGRSYWMSTPSNTITEAQWEWFMNLKFATSGSNYVDVFLSADQADLSQAQNGYFVRIGDTPDEVSLYVLENGSSTILVDGPDKQVESSSNNPLRIKVTRDINDLWTLSVDDGNTGSYQISGTATNATHNSSSFFGLLVVQSTAASPKSNHFFDDFEVGAIVVDTQAPSLISATVVSDTQVDLLFSESLDQTTAENIANYQLTPANTLLSATLDGGNLGLVHLVYGSAFGDGIEQSITCNNIADLSGNSLSNESTTFTYFAPAVPQFQDLIITEFLCDPSPSQGLPEFDFVEIYNKSNSTLNLKNWKIADGVGAGTISEAFIAPGEYKVLCTAAAVDSFPNAVAVSSFPNFNNTGDQIILKDSLGNRIDSLEYDQSWYQDDSKSGGGYTIELINPFSSCSGDGNWKASTNPQGGTPGAQNAVFNTDPDSESPEIVGLEILPPNFVSVTFSEKMDSLSLINASILVTPGLTVKNRFVSESYPVSVLIEFNETIQDAVLYTLTLDGVADCSQNSTKLQREFVIAPSPKPGDLIINEILYDPVTGGADYVELKNISNSILSLKDLAIGNYDDDSISNLKSINQEYILKTGALIVITPDSAFQQQYYPYHGTGNYIEMSLPSMNNDSGSVYLIYQQQVIDHVSYDDDWQFALLSSSDGKSLERIDPNGPSNQSDNWHTAAETVGFGTPGLPNSQLKYGENDGQINLVNDIFSPDNDGIDDVLLATYSMLKAGMVANARIFDDRGRPVKQLFQAELLASEGQFSWDGVTDQGQKASIGTYVLLFEAFDLNGNQFAKKLSFVLAGKL
ncbi:MAG: hypothetical protein EP338_05595 [Bacteroidetes bacterium]|nr:MAG: hypothetical protein EP338_05595 [Bacteroidota bacterium]